MGIFHFNDNKSIKDQMLHCKDNRAALKVAGKIKTLDDCCEFVEFCPISCAAVGDKVLELIQDDRALYKIILSDTVISYFRQQAFDKISPSYYQTILEDAGGKLSLEMKDRVQRTLAEERRKALVTNVSQSDDIPYLESIVKAPSTDGTVAAKALLKLIDLYAKNKTDEQDFNGRIIDLFTDLPHYVPKVFNKVFDPQTLLTIVRQTQSMDYKEDALHRILYIGHHHSMKKPYRLGLNESVYRDTLQFLSECYTDLPEAELEFFKDSGEALKDIRQLMPSEKTNLDALLLLVERNHLQREELLAEYKDLNGNENRTAEEIRRVIAKRLCTGSLAEKESAILGDVLDFDGKMVILGSLKKLQDEESLALERKCAAYLAENPDPAYKLGYWYYEIGSSISPPLAEELGIVIDTYEVKDEDQFGRYTYDEYTVSYRGEKYWDVKTKKR